MFVGLNPSTADETADDPTVRRCMAFAKRWGYGGIYMLNLFALRSTDPRALRAAPDPVGPGNDSHLVMYADKLAHLVIAAWGVHGPFQDRGLYVRELLRATLSPSALLCLGTTKGGHPRHPLYLSADVQPRPYW